MRIVAAADLHGRLPAIPDCDVLVIAGDICADFQPFSCNPNLARLRQTEWLTTVFAPWEQSVPAKHIVVTPGNHDWVTELPVACRARFLVDTGVRIDGIHFYGTPWVPPIGSWNYCLSRSRRKQLFASIPHDVDVLVTHTPPHRVLDYSYEGEPCGCPELRFAIYQKKPRVCVFGHIHEGRRHGFKTRLGDTDCYNASMWESTWQPLVIDL